MKKEMLINVLQPEECRIAIVEDNVLEELYVERTSQESYVGNIYKGRIVNIEPSIQAAFVDFGVGRNGFLHVSDVEPAYYRHLEQRRDSGRRGDSGSRRQPGDRPPRRDRPDEEGESRDRRGRDERGPSRGRGGSRGRSHRRDPEPRTDDVLPPEGIEVAPPSEPTAPAEELGFLEETTFPRPEHDDLSFPDERPRYMDSAEHRTEEGKPKPEIGDDDLFFPRSEPTASPPPRAEREPAALPPEEHDYDPEPYSPPADEYRTEDLPQDQPSEEFLFDPESEEPDSEEFGEEALTEFDPDLEEIEPMRRPRRGGRDGRDDRRGRRGERGGPRRGGPGRLGMGQPKPLIQDIFKRGQEVLVQVIKEGIGTKGPTLSTYISIAGRYLVLMPGLNRIGVSRKITDEEQRRRLREILSELQPPKGLGFIIRTAGLDKTKKELQRDLMYLSRLWQVMVRRINKLKSPCEIYQESDMITRTIRDTFTNEIDTIWVDEKNAFEHAQEFLQIVMPRYSNRIQKFEDAAPLFHKYGIEEEISRIQLRHVPLPHGGSIVIDQTEALVAIDVNSGNFRADNNAEETAYQMNLQAAKEIARQLRLRDLGGVIVNDFIDMREEKHRRDVEHALRDAVRRDRARTKILKISAFGIIEMTRQRIRPSLKRSVYQDCPHCRSTGQVKTCESMSIDVMRMIQLAAHKENVQRIEIQVHQDVANYLHNRKRREVSRLEEEGEIQVFLHGQTAVSPEFLEFVCYDNNNNEVKFLPYDENRPRRR